MSDQTPELDDSNWASCMRSKIANAYGLDAAQCVSAGSSGNLGAIVTCIVGIVTDTDPAAVLTNLVKWSAECLFAAETESAPPAPGTLGTQAPPPRTSSGNGL